LEPLHIEGYCVYLRVGGNAMTNDKQTYPDFKTDFLITVEKPFPKLYVDKLFTEKLGDIHLTIEVREIDRDKSYSNGEWISSSSFINLYINDSFITNHFLKGTQDVNVFLEKFQTLIEPVTKITTSIKGTDTINRTRPFATFSSFYRTKDEYVFQYLFELEGNVDEYIKALTDVFNSITKYNESEDNAFKKAVHKSYSQSYRKKYLLYIDKEWNVLNPLLEVGKEINTKYREKKDFRIKKPHILMHRDDYRKYFVLDNNWVLTFDGLETLMIKPNDVSLYSNISDTNLKRAKEFFQNTILPRYKQYHGSFPSEEKQKEYYDYFELIISALIFAYTSLEAFANICIPDRYEYLIEKDGIKTFYSKSAIEKKFSLREKFKNILRSILNTPDPTQEKWWSIFIDLERLRDEIIHTKQSKSEDRYSQLLSKKVFDIIEVHKTIINYYGHFISENKKELLEEFPYNFGFDDFFPGLTDDKGYEKSYRVLHNIPEKNNGEE
jgi:hypothetical protein